jgi:hypothetical protein
MSNIPTSRRYNLEGYHAPTKVFGTAELLHAILLKLDSRTLLLAQRVNCAFQDTITRSSQLQKKLFFKPVKFLAEAHDLGMIDERSVVASFCAWPRMDKQRVLFEQLGALILNPMVFTSKVFSSKDRRRGMAKVQASCLKSVQRDPSPSWKKMLASQPPKDIWMLRFTCYDRPGRAERSHQEHYKPGLSSIGDIVNAIIEHLESNWNQDTSSTKVSLTVSIPLGHSKYELRSDMHWGKFDDNWSLLHFHTDLATKLERGRR